jgi:non-specific serine/threonine protein kinase
MIGELSRLSGDYEQAGQAYEECLVECRRSGHKVRELVTIGNLAYVVYHQGDYERAKALELYIQPQFRDLGLRYHIVAGFPTLVGTVAAQGDPRRAACLLGAADALFEIMGVNLKRADQFELDRNADVLRQQLDQETFEKAYTQGRAMSLEEALACAMGQVVQ